MQEEMAVELEWGLMETYILLEYSMMWMGLGQDFLIGELEHENLLIVMFVLAEP
jgi:hypothetical protein